MKEFETHPVGTAEEIKLSRQLAREVEQVIRQYGRVVPNNVIQAYIKLKELYDRQIEQGML